VNLEVGVWMHMSRFANAERSESGSSSVTALLDEVRRGDRSALVRLFPLVYDQLLEVARIQRRRQPDADTLNTTALVHEAFIKLVASEALSLQDRAHFLAVAATAMRQILIGHARRHAALKRGAGSRPVPFEVVERALESESGFGDAKADALLALDTALSRLAQHSDRQRQIVECRFFGGLTVEETATALGISPATVKRDWSIAQTWLHRELQRELG
jgi:RNA polymerase sigma factor (TIGR02999 family)